jgi:hypothetical protein
MTKGMSFRKFSPILSSVVRNSIGEQSVNLKIPSPFSISPPSSLRMCGKAKMLKIKGFMQHDAVSKTGEQILNKILIPCYQVEENIHNFQKERGRRSFSLCNFKLRGVYLSVHTKVDRLFLLFSADELFLAGTNRRSRRPLT